MTHDDIRKAYNHDAREAALRKFTSGLVETFLDMGFFRSCLNCEHWNTEHSKTKPPETCGKHGNQRPPARIIVTGCEDHTDTIPF